VDMKDWYPVGDGYLNMSEQLEVLAFVIRVE